MSGLRYAVVPLRIVLVLTFLLLLVAEVMSFPGMFSYQARQSDDFAEVRWPLLAVVELGLICVQVVIVSTWRLLTMVREDRVFSRDSLRWVDAILAAIGVAWLLGLGMVLVVVAAADDPGNVMAAMLILFPATSFALLMVVMRALLVQATELRSDMEGVI